MKVAITGHTRGLGAELWKRFDDKDTLIGFSKSTGHDISHPQHRILLYVMRLIAMSLSTTHIVGLHKRIFLSS